MPDRAVRRAARNTCRGECGLSDGADEDVVAGGCDEPHPLVDRAAEGRRLEVGEDRSPPEAFPHGGPGDRLGVAVAAVCRQRADPADARHPVRQIERRSEEHTSELQSLRHLVCRLLLEKKNVNEITCNEADASKAAAYATSPR